MRQPVPVARTRQFCGRERHVQGRCPWCGSTGRAGIRRRPWSTGCHPAMHPVPSGQIRRECVQRIQGDRPVRPALRQVPARRARRHQVEGKADAIVPRWGDPGSRRCGQARHGHHTAPPGKMAVIQPRRGTSESRGGNCRPGKPARENESVEPRRGYHLRLPPINP